MDIEIPPKLVKCTRTAWRNNRNSVKEEFLQDILKSQKNDSPSRVFDSYLKQEG